MAMEAAKSSVFVSSEILIAEVESHFGILSLPVELVYYFSLHFWLYLSLFYSLGLFRFSGSPYMYIRVDSWRNKITNYVT